MGGGMILLVEDEASIADVVEYALREHGFHVRIAEDGNKGLSLFRRHKPDLVILDLNLPGLSGLDLFGRMRQEQPGVPVIMLTARTDEVDRVAGLEMGADDYVTKPFSPRELTARVRSVLRRFSGGDDGGGRDVLTAGPVTVDVRQWIVACRGRGISLSRQEFRLVECLVRHPARIFPRDVLIDLIYDGETCVTERSIDAQVKRIRRKAAEVCPGLDPIRTVYGMGYKLNESLAEAEDDGEPRREDARR